MTIELQLLVTCETVAAFLITATAVMLGCWWFSPKFN